MELIRTTTPARLTCH